MQHLYAQLYYYGAILSKANYVASGLNKNINYAYTTAALTGVGTNLIGTDANTTSNVITSLTYRGFGGLKEFIQSRSAMKATTRSREESVMPVNTHLKSPLSFAHPPPVTAAPERTLY